MSEFGCGDCCRSGGVWPRLWRRIEAGGTVRFKGLASKSPRTPSKKNMVDVIRLLFGKNEKKDCFEARLTFIPARSLLEHEFLSGINGPIVSLSRPPESFGQLNETLVETQVVSDGVLPSLVGSAKKGEL